jgi:hypothetical protein
MSGDQVPDVPGVVARAAEEHGLGAVRPPEPGSRWSGSTTHLVVLSAVVAVAIGLALAGQWFWFGGAAFVGVALLAGAFSDWRSERSPDRVGVHGFDGGVVWVRREVVRAFRWDEIEYVERAFYSPGAQGGGSWSYRYRIRPRGGDVSSELELPERSAVVASGTARVALERAHASLAAGRPVRFGPVTVGPEGLSTADRSLLWHEVDRVVLKPQFVEVRQRSRPRIWRSVPIGEVPDARALAEVADELARIAFRPE